MSGKPNESGLASAHGASRIDGTRHRRSHGAWLRTANLSVKASSWAWQVQCPAATKTVLLALADHADDEGIAWPGRKGLAEKVGITDRNITRHLSQLERAGTIVSIPRYRADGSRTTNLYRLTMISVSPPLDATIQAPSSPASIPLDAAIQTRTIIEPSLEPSKKKERTEHQKVFQELQAIRGYPSGNGAAEGKAIKQMFSQHYTAAEILQCYSSLKDQPFWADKPVSMMTVGSQIGEWKANQNGQRNTPAGKPTPTEPSPFAKYG